MKKIVLFLLIITFFFSFGSVSATTREAYYILLNPAEDMSTSINVVWHSDISDSFLEYTVATDTSYANKVTLMPDVRTFSKPANDNGVLSQGIGGGGFAQRYVNNVTIEGLTPNTKYMVRVGKTSFSTNYYFTTASNNTFSFLSMTDPQYGSESQSNIFNNLITTGLNIEPDLRFTMITGDTIDRGGIEQQWAWFFTRSNIPKMPFALGVGNHEYYDASPSPQHVDNSWFNAFTNNPKNGATTLLNSSYHFRYNNVLFIMIDTEGGQAAAQREWFARAVESNIDADFVIVGMHRSFYGSIYASASIAVRETWLRTFDKYGVDLAFSGHDHVYARSYHAYNNAISTDPIRGTTYVIGGYAGNKNYGAQPDPMYAKVIEGAGNPLATIVDVDDEKLSMRVYNQYGQIVDTYTINKKRIGEIDPTFTKAAFLDGIEMTSDTTYKNVAHVTWPDNGFKNVSSIRVIHGRFGYEMQGAYLYHEDFTSLTFSGVGITTLNEFHVEVLFADGTTEVLTFEIDNRPVVPIVYLTFKQALNIIFDEFNAALFRVIGD